MGGLIMHIVKIEIRPETRIRWPGEEIQAAVTRQQFVSLFDHGRHRGKNKNIVVSFSAGEGTQVINRITRS